ncbi:MAG: hypothetical protein Q9192_004960 [Flavoplaca navasiana]
MEDGRMRTAATGEIRVFLASDVADSAVLFPSRPLKPHSELLSVNIKQFYESLSKIGLDYSGPFRAITSAERRMDMASAVITIDQEVGASISVHPTWLDACFQTFLAAYAAPRDGSLWTAFMPTTIGRMTFSPAPSVAVDAPTTVTVDAQITEFTPGFQSTLPTINGDMSIYDSTTGQLAVRIEDFTMSSFLPAAAKDDRLLYLKTVWQQDILSGAAFGTDQQAVSPYELKAIDACEKAIHHYLSKLSADKSFHEIAENFPGLNDLLAKIAARDANEQIPCELSPILEEFRDHIDMMLVKTVGNQLLNNLRRPVEDTAEASTSLGDLVSRWHNEGLGMAQVQKLMELGHAMDSYTIMDRSADALEAIKVHLTLDQLRVDYKVIDVEDGLEDLGDITIAAGSFDLVIIHKAFRKQMAALKTVRSLLRPGGFMLMMAATGNTLRFPFFLLSAPPPVKEEDGPVQPRFTNATSEETHCVLQNAGFSGVDCIALDNIPENHTFAVVVSQAVDDQISFLRAPLASASLQATSKKLVILGGSSFKVANFIRLVRTKLSRVWDGQIIPVESLADAKTLGSDKIDYILSLTELDSPVLKHLSASTFKNLQRLLEMSKTILWITQRARSESPYQNGMIGLGRTFQSENPQKILQFLDLDTLECSESLVAESILRLIGAAVTRDNDPKRSHLWNIEPEIAVEKGNLLIPRLLPDVERNHRLNSLKRNVETQALVGTQHVSLVRSFHHDDEVVYTAEESLHGQRDFAQSSVDSDQISLRVEYCSKDPVMPNYNEKDLFCCIGRTKEGTHFLALSDSNSSAIVVPRVWTVRLNNEDLQQTTAVSVLMHVLNEVMSQVIKKSMPLGYTTLLYGLDADLAITLDRRNDIPIEDLAFISHQAQTTHIHRKTSIWARPYMSRDELALMIPPRTRLLIHMRQGTDARKLLNIKRVLPTNTTIVCFDHLDVDGLVPQEVLLEALDLAKRLSSSPKTAPDRAKVVQACALVREGTKRHVDAAVVNWTGDQIITLTQKPVDPRYLFSADKTYLLVGLTGQIGQSMCRWMVKNGAQHIVVTSRNPDKEGLWKEELQRQGASIAIEAVDVTKMQDLVDLRSRILATMPRIGGVANGAMVLSDKMFADMTYESFQDVLKPKVDGSRNLDEIFSGDDLDFFILFSSISAVTGQRSQANYAAANNYMVGLALERRARNLPASVIDIGMVIGIGVVTRTEDGEGISAMETALRKLDYMPVSERDLHHLLAEAIVAGRSDQSPEIVTGLETYNTASGNKPFWHKIHAFRTSSEKTLKEKLTDASGPDDALLILEGALLAYLASSLKLSIESIYANVPVIDLGIDSLVAVEIRNWIFSEAGHDVPVLKILGGSSVRQICSEVVASFSFERKQIDASETQSQTAPPPKSDDLEKLAAETTSLEASSDESPADETLKSSVSSGQMPGPDSSSSSISSVPLPPKDPLGGSQLTSLSATVATQNVVAKSHPRPTPVRTESLSLGQSRLYFLSLYLEDDTVLNCTVSYAVSGKLDGSKLRKALGAVIERHETLRTVFFTQEHDGEPLQGVLDKSNFNLKSISGDSDGTDVKKEFQQIQKYHYNLETGDTFIATVLSHNAGSHTIIFGYHHIIMDGVSWQIFQRDLAKFYNDPNSISSPASQPAQYMDFTLKQQREMSDGAYGERIKYFQTEFRDQTDPLPLFPFAKVSTRRSLKQYAVRDVVTHMCIGMVDANRSDQSFSNTIGFFLETIPLLFKVNSEQKFSDVLQSTRTKAYAALAQTGVPTEEILRACNVAASTTETPLFQVVFNYRMGASRTSPLQGVDMKFLEYADAKNPFDLVVSVDELDSGTAMLTFSLQDYLYDQEGAELLANTYAHLLKVLSKDTASSVGSISMFDDASTQQAVALGTGPKVEFVTKSTDTLSKIVDTWIGKDQEVLAVKDVNGNTKTYRQLSERVNAICAALLRSGTAASCPICVLLDPNVDTIATILGILRVGAAYVPLDIRSTNERLGDILEESGSTVLIYHAATAHRARELHRLSESARGTKLISLATVPQKTVQRVEDVSTLDGLAMILYTSGSTGKAKGIPLTNANIMTTILDSSGRLSLGREVVLQQSGQGFDAAVYQIFIALANGGTLIMGDNRNHPAELAALMVREGVTCSVFIVSEMQSILKYGYKELCKCTSWRIAIVAREAFTTNLLQQFRSLNRQDLRIINAYGPTEASICSSMHEVSYSDIDTDGFSIPIGKALANYGTYIVNEESRPVPIGWLGEIAISGPGVASGYWNLPELTARKFKHQSSWNVHEEWNRLYLTGDKGRMLSDGSILMSGRVDGDDQVKIRGMRVQLDDVSKALVQASCGDLVDAAVLVRLDDRSNPRLIAYVVFSRSSQVQDKRAYLRQLNQELPIPAHMRPTVTIPLETLPVTERGKLDSRKLAASPLPKEPQNEETDDQLTEHEIRLRDVWRNVLGDISFSLPIRRSSDFFSVGGNSLLLLPLKTEIRRVFGVDIPLPELFQSSTLQLLAGRLTGDAKTVHIDWENETKVDVNTFLSPRLANGHHTQTLNTNAISVLLTGATGFLGTAILRQLVQLPHVARVHCAAIRPDAQTKKPRTPAIDSPKIVRHTGDLALPNLGMSQPQIENLLDDIDIIIHNGAEVSHMKSYRSLRATNFLSTVQLARLAVRGPNQIPFHYISTGGVARLSGAAVQPESSLAAYHPPTDGSDGYVASKWASEVLLERIQQHTQAPVWIHRPSSITGEEVPALDIVHSVLRYSKMMKAVPDLAGSSGAFDFIHVDTVAREIVASCTVGGEEEEEETVSEGENKVDGGRGLKYVHHSGEEIVPVDQLKGYLESSAGGSFKVLSIKEWVAGAMERGLDEVLGSFLLASKGVVRVPLLRKSHGIK